MNKFLDGVVIEKCKDCKWCDEIFCLHYYNEKQVNPDATDKDCPIG